MDTKQQKRRATENYEMDVLQKVNSRLMEGSEYMAELNELASNGSTEAEDKKKVRFFFSLTDEVQDQLESAAEESKKVYTDELANGEEVSVDVVEEEKGAQLPVYHDITVSSDDESTGNDDNVVYDVDDESSLKPAAIDDK